jgi:hypothetical protein
MLLRVSYVGYLGALVTLVVCEIFLCGWLRTATHQSGCPFLGELYEGMELMIPVRPPVCDQASGSKPLDRYS